MKSMLLKTCVLLPFVLVGGYFFVALFGVIALATGASETFYCGFFCKFGVGFMIAVVGALVAFQAKKSYTACHTEEV